MAKTNKKTIDVVFIWLGTITTIVLLALGCLAWRGGSFALNSVHKELASQKIYFPAKGTTALDPVEFPDLQQYAGQLVDNGPKAKAYADGFIGRHLEKIANGKTYAEVSTLSMADPTNKALAGQKTALFQGETLRGLLLGDGYAYWTIGQVAQYAGMVAFAAAGVTALLTWVGIMRLSKLK